MAALERRTGARLGLAYAPIHTAGTPSVVGRWITGPAWSSSKVPLAVAALRAHPSAATRADVTAAITRSDNAAAQRLWDAFGGAREASDAMQQVLAEGDNAGVLVPTRPLRSGYTIFGQTQWSLVGQVRFAARLGCLTQGPAVLGEMGRVTSSQRWGLGRLDASFKGGWGPDESGRYVARQFGIVHLASGDLAIAIAAEPADGRFETATAELDQLAALVRTQLRGQAVTPC